jgi:hypothetical protein
MKTAHRWCGLQSVIKVEAERHPAFTGPWMWRSAKMRAANALAILPKTTPF